MNDHEEREPEAQQPELDLEGLEQTVEDLEGMTEEQDDPPLSCTPFILQLAAEEEGDEVQLTEVTRRGGRVGYVRSEAFVLNLSPEAPTPVEHGQKIVPGVPGVPAAVPPPVDPEAEALALARAERARAEHLAARHRRAARRVIELVLKKVFRPLGPQGTRKPVCEELNVTTREQAQKLRQRLRAVLGYVTEDELQKLAYIDRAIGRRFDLRSPPPIAPPSP